MSGKNTAPGSEGEQEVQLEEKLEDAGGEDLGHLQGKTLLFLCLAEKGEEVEGAKCLHGAQLSDNDEDVVEESEKEERDKRNDERPPQDRRSVLGDCGRLDKTQDRQANRWHLEKRQSHDLEILNK